MSDSSIAFDQAASYYDDTRGFPPGIDREVGAFIANAGGLDANSQVLEIGIGTGRIALPLAAHVGGIVGVDLAIPMMQRLRHKRQAYAGRIDLIQGDILQLPLADASFDAGLMVHILHLVPDPQQAVRELARVLKPGGIALQGRNARGEEHFTPLADAWLAATQHAEVPQDRWQRGNTALDDAGWRVRSEHAQHYSVDRTPDQAADSYRKRVWSALWSVPDDVWRVGVAAVEAALAAHYPDPHAPVPITNTFHLKIYTPPA